MKKRIGPTQSGYDRILALCPEAKEWPMGASVEIKPVKRTRSLDQNARYWAIVGALATYSGDTKQGIHEDALIEYHGSETVMLPSGRYRTRAIGRSSKLSTEDFSNLMMIVEKWAADMGVVWNEYAA